MSLAAAVQVLVSVEVEALGEEVVAYLFLPVQPLYFLVKETTVGTQTLQVFFVV
jgi:hypothetical protein